MLNEYVDVKEGSQLTGYSEPYLRILAARGDIEAQKIGNAWALSRASLLRFAEQQEQGDGRFGPRSGVVR
jgi:hypothetical protein